MAERDAGGDAEVVEDVGALGREDGLAAADVAEADGARVGGRLALHLWLCAYNLGIVLFCYASSHPGREIHMEETGVDVAVADTASVAGSVGLEWSTQRIVKPAHINDTIGPLRARLVVSLAGRLREAPGHAQ